ncbi:uncharacterized protein LOC111300394 [Durio zibethinus]|uniref:Uncharacterized protein LOC111300394 n=1 Tax=Durio zibethinus TaxID=66656 RepID=A0A6P5ZGZ3_DURZI|nr:uncharacterized protein LOC111300394 [Durio zibethinus]
MKDRSSKQETKEGMEIDKISNLKKPRLSSAYIRSLVKQLTSSRTKDPMNPKDPDSADADGFIGQNLTKFGEGFIETSQIRQPQPPQQHKKQVRRRLHTSRRYQERLLNMAEARREIVTALKFHRAAMKKANEQQQQELQQQQLAQPSHLSSSPPFEQKSKTKCRRNPRKHPSSTSNFSAHNLDNFSYSSFSQHYPPPNPYSWPASPIPLPYATDTSNFTLPNQTLGLNLNFHDFNNIDTSLYHKSNKPSIYSSSSSSSSSSPTLSVLTEKVPSVALSHEVGPTAMADLAESYGGGGLHQAMDDEEIAEIRSLGEQHQMEWNDTMNLVTSAWWFKFLKTVELGPELKAEDDGSQPFDQVLEFPAWLNTNDSCLQQHFNDVCPNYCFQDPALPCMDIGEIEGMDGEWLA